VAVASAVEFFCFETMAAAPLQNVETLPLELCEDLWEARNDPRIQRRMREVFGSSLPE
jgi:hypothetical protein